jgi:hypothetical protein
MATVNSALESITDDDIVQVFEGEIFSVKCVVEHEVYPYHFSVGSGNMDASFDYDEENNTVQIKIWRLLSPPGDDLDEFRAEFRERMVPEISAELSRLRVTNMGTEYGVVAPPAAFSPPGPTCPVILQSKGRPCGRSACAAYWLTGHCGLYNHLPAPSPATAIDRLTCPVILQSKGRACGRSACADYWLTGHCGLYNHRPDVIPSPLSSLTRAIILVGHSHYGEAPVRSLSEPGVKRTIIQYADVGNYLPREDVDVFLHGMSVSQRILDHAGNPRNSAKIVQDTYKDHAVCGDESPGQSPQCGVYLWNRNHQSTGQVTIARSLKDQTESVSIRQAFEAYPDYPCVIFLGCRILFDSLVAGMEHLVIRK